MHLPKRCVEHARIVGIDGEVDGSGLCIAEVNLAPVLSAIGRTEDAALIVRSIRMPERGDVYDVRIARVYAHAADRLRVGETDVTPGTPGIARAIHAVAL